MTFDPEKHHRQSIRLRGYDYVQEGVYFVTVCTQDRQCLFGEIVDGKTSLNEAGAMIEYWWFELDRKFPTVETDEFVVMPNHFHGIIVIADVTVGADLRVGPVPTDLRVGPNSEGAHTAKAGAHAAQQGAHTGAPLRAPVFACQNASQRSRERAPLPTVVQWFKTMTTNEYIRGVKTRGWSSFRSRLWQRNYYEHIIRDEESLDRIRRYIVDNPARWTMDRENPSATTFEPEDAWRD